MKSTQLFTLAFIFSLIGLFVSTHKSFLIFMILIILTGIFDYFFEKER